jgi:hypothetical protein
LAFDADPFLVLSLWDIFSRKEERNGGTKTRKRGWKAEYDPSRRLPVCEGREKKEISRES